MRKSDDVREELVLLFGKDLHFDVDTKPELPCPPATNHFVLVTLAILVTLIIVLLITVIVLAVR